MYNDGRNKRAVPPLSVSLRFKEQCAILRAGEFGSPELYRAPLMRYLYERIREAFSASLAINALVSTVGMDLMRFHVIERGSLYFFSLF